MTKSGGTIERFQDNGKCQNGEMIKVSSALALWDAPIP
jgi:hypothetical protein